MTAENIKTSDAALKQCEKMISEGADFIDLGAYSSRPGAEEVSPTEEINRLLPCFNRIAKRVSHHPVFY